MTRTESTIIVHDPVEYDVAEYVRRHVDKVDAAYTALQNALHCDAYQDEVVMARSAAMRLEDACDELHKALRRVQGAPDDD